MANYNTKHLIGKRFGLLTVVQDGTKPRGAQGPYLLCRCDCGTEKEVARGRLTRTRWPARSCGCNRVATIRAKNTRHGHWVNRRCSTERNAWNNMKERCYNRKNKSFKNYGARGITVCDRWLESFDNFLADMGLKPRPDMTIERKDNNKGYEPGNCIWAGWGTQAKNRRKP